MEMERERERERRDRDRDRQRARESARERERDERERERRERETETRERERERERETWRDFNRGLAILCEDSDNIRDMTPGSLFAPSALLPLAPSPCSLRPPPLCFLCSLFSPCTRNTRTLLYVYQSETTPFYPRSPYACAKLMAYWCCVNYRYCVRRKLNYTLVRVCARLYTFLCVHRHTQSACVPVPARLCLSLSLSLSLSLISVVAGGVSVW
jgi:hypothetical protein